MEKDVDAALADTLCRDLDPLEVVRMMTRCARAFADMRDTDAAVACVGLGLRYSTNVRDKWDRIACLIGLGGAAMFVSSAVAEDIYHTLETLAVGVSDDDIHRHLTSRFPANDGRVAMLDMVSVVIWWGRRGCDPHREVNLQAMLRLYSQNVKFAVSQLPLVHAMIRSDRVTEDIQSRRIAACAVCDHRLEKGGVTVCDITEAKVSGRGMISTDMTLYQEHLPDWGCRHPLRGKGGGWPLQL